VQQIGETKQKKESLINEINTISETKHHKVELNEEIQQRARKQELVQEIQAI
jgi:hypothetical protein